MREKIYNIVFFDISWIVFYLSCFSPVVLNKLGVETNGNILLLFLSVVIVSVTVFIFSDRISRAWTALNTRISQKICMMSLGQKEMILWVLSVVFCILHFLRCFGICFWYDECVSIVLYAKTTLGGLIDNLIFEQTTPPFYATLLNIMSHTFGQTAFVYHITSLIPIIVLFIFNISVIRPQYGYAVAYQMVVFLGMSTAIISFAVEVRHYSWAIFWVFLCGYSLCRIINDDSRKRYKILFIVSGILASYTQYFAFAEICVIYGIFFLYTLFKKRELLRFFFVSVIISVCAYAPWLSVFADSAYSISSMKSSVMYVPDTLGDIYYTLWAPVGQRGLVLWVFFIAALIQVAADKEVEKSTKQVVYFSVLPFLGMTVCGMGLDRLFKTSVYTPRYLTPVFLLLLFAFSVAFASTKHKYSVVLSVLLFSIILFTPHYIDHYSEDIKNSRLVQESIDTLSTFDPEHTVFVSDYSFSLRAMFELYFSDFTTVLSIDGIETYSDKDVFYVVQDWYKKDYLSKISDYDYEEAEHLYFLDRPVTLYKLTSKSR